MSSRAAAGPRKRQPQSTPPRKMHDAQTDHPKHVKTAPLLPASRFQTYLALTSIFIAWKLILLAVVLATPTDGSGYDTSADLFFNLRDEPSDLVGSRDAVTANRTSSTYSSLLVSRIATRLTRWDAIYLISAAWKGYLHEQDWAFSFGYTAAVGWCSKVLHFCKDDVVNIVVHGILNSNLCHLLSTFILFQLASLLTPSQLHNKRVAFVASVLHILSPAGVFLLAPYSEAPFAFLSFLASFFYAKGILEFSRESNRIWNEAYIIAAGFSFGLAAMVRSNGLFAGVIFACDAAIWFVSKAFATSTSSFTDSRLLPSIWSTIIAGTLVGIGFAYPQIAAYREYCMNGPEQPPWCTALPPSITTYIQAHYWNVGLFKYWTVSNIPLFLLAAPMLYVLFSTSLKVLQNSAPKSREDRVSAFVMCRLVLPQLAVAVLTFTTAHVQIVNRLSSGYPVWIICLAHGVVSADVKEQRWTKIAVRLMVMYGIIQAALFSAFLPPA